LSFFRSQERCSEEKGKKSEIERKSPKRSSIVLSERKSRRKAGGGSYDRDR
jgi:hypothetical protein